MTTDMQEVAEAPWQPGSGVGVSRGRAALSNQLRRHHRWLAPLLYLIGAMIIEQNAVAHMGSHIAADMPMDATQFFWTMWWWPHALLHFDNPFVTSALWVPHGLDLAAMTGIPLPSTLLAPVTAVFGPIVSYNVLTLAAPVINGWFTYRLCLRLTNAPGASIAAGWLFAFCTYTLGELSAGHVNLMLVFGPPAVLLLTARRLDGTLTVRRYVVLTAVVLAAQMLSNPEILFSMTVLVAIAVLCGLAVTTGETRRRVLALIVPLGLAYALTAVVCSPFIYYLLTGPALSKGVDRLYFADLLSYAFPTPITLIFQHPFQGLSSNFFSGLGETGTYVGIAGIFVFAACAFESWGRSAIAKVLVVTTFVAGVLSLGITLEVAGHTSIWLPYDVVADFPGFTEALPVRIGMFVELGVAIAAALWLAYPRRLRLTRWVVVLAAIVLIWPNIDGVVPSGNASNQATPLYDTSLAVPATPFSVPAFFSDGAYKRFLSPNEVILTIPYGREGADMLWQAVAHGYFRMAGAYFGWVPPVFFNDPVFQDLYGLTPFLPSVPVMRSFLRRHEVGAVVIEARQGGPWPGLMRQMGLNAEYNGGVVVYPLPPSMR